MIEEHHIPVQRTARYYTLGTLSEKTRRVWVVLHGYGQLARHFIRRFDVVADEETLVIAPEGLSRFYTDQQAGKVGASWITREERDHEVVDYVAYLDQVLATVLADRSLDRFEITLMGFSQGASTVCRWLEKSELLRAKRLVLWAGFFPNGLSDVLRPETVAGMSVEYVYGLDDDYISHLPDVEQYLHRLVNDIPHLQLIPFSGKHVVDRVVLQSLLSSTSQ
jgi:predicted esterase